MGALVITLNSFLVLSTKFIYKRFSKNMGLQVGKKSGPI